MIIELTKKTTSFHLFDSKPLAELQEAVKAEQTDERAFGFTDLDFSEGARGTFSMLEPFDVEAFKDGFNTTLTLERKESCEFVADDTILCAWGDSAAIKLLRDTLALNALDFSFEDLYRLQAQMQLVKNIKLKNPKEMPVRNASLSGRLECYEEFNIIQPNNHTISSVSGKFDAIGMGEISLCVTEKGVVKIGVKQLCDMDFDTIKHLVKVIYGK